MVVVAIQVLIWRLITLYNQDENHTETKLVSDAGQRGGSIVTGGRSCGLRRNHASCSAQKYIDGGGLTYYSVGDDVGSLVHVGAWRSSETRLISGVKMVNNIMVVVIAAVVFHVVHLCFQKHFQTYLFNQ